MNAATRAVAVAVGTAFVLAAWIWSSLDDWHPARPAPLAHAAAPAAAPLADAVASLNAAAQAKGGGRDPAAFQRWLNEQSSLRGIVLDGAWDVSADGRLQPTLALRRRFDQLLSLLGEATLDELTAFIAYDVEDLASPAAAQQVLDVWQRYVALQRHAFQQQADPRDQRSLLPVLAERQQVRRQLLGSAVASAFYADDEGQLQALLQGTVPAAPTVTPNIDRSSLSPQALARLRQAESEQADWERKLADAQREWSGLQAQAALSAVQRSEAIERFLAPRFDVAERVRVRALLHLPRAATPG